LPGLSGFPAEFLIFKGAFPLAPVACAAAVLGLLLTAIYLLTFFGNVFYGPLNEKRASSAELTFDERLIVIPAIVITFVLGLAPQLVIALFNPAVTSMVQQLR
jgi:NADH-quinone oxidoreductase subunit M